MPGLFEKLFTGEDPTRLAEKNGQQFVFVGGQVENVATALDAHRVIIVMKKGRCWFLRCLPSTHDGPDPCHNSAGGKGFGDVIIRSKLESEDLVDFRIPRGEEKDGNLGKGPDLTAEIEAGEIRKSDVEDREIRRMLVEVIQSFLTSRDMSDRKIFGLKSIDQGVRDRGFVFDDQNGRHCGERVSTG